MTSAPAVSGTWVYSAGMDGAVHKYSALTGTEIVGNGWPLTFSNNPRVEKVSANLVVVGSYLYVATSGFVGDGGHYEGHVVTANNVFFATGNGPWNGQTNWGDSVLKLSPDGSQLLDSYTPNNQAYLNAHDQDVGSTGPAILPSVTSGHTI
jgi:hypothetical protein